MSRASDEGKYTPVCWSVTAQVRAHMDGTLHMQGYDYGKPGRTICGRAYEPPGTGALWEFEVHDYPPAQFKGCRHCEASYKAHMKRSSQKPAAAEPEAEQYPTPDPWPEPKITVCGFCHTEQPCRFDGHEYTCADAGECHQRSAQARGPGAWRPAEIAPEDVPF